MQDLTCCLLRYSFISFSWLASTALLCSMAALQCSCCPLSWGFTSVCIPADGLLSIMKQASGHFEPISNKVTKHHITVNVELKRFCCDKKRIFCQITLSRTRSRL